MANAKKCDVCNSLYEPYEKSIGREGKCNGVAFICKGTMDWVGRRLLDCCPTCFDAITNLITKLGDKSNKEEFYDDRK